MASVKKTYLYEPDYAVPPGETLRDTLEALKMHQDELALRIELSPRMISQIISGEERITYLTADKLEKGTGVPASLWNKLESNYRDRLLKLRNLEQLKKDIVWLKKIPVNELIKRNIIQKKQNKAEQLQAVLAFFGVSSVKAWQDLWTARQIAARKSASFESKIEATATWIRLGELQVQRMQLNKYDKTSFKKTLREIRALSSSPSDDFADKVKQQCAECGVAVVYVQEISGAPWSGASWWHADTPIIQLSLRYKTDDQFWFSFFHEAGHVLNDSKKELFVTDDKNTNDKNIDPREVAANAFAADFLIPREYAPELRAICSAQSIKAFAKRLGISPGIVVGRMQHDRHLKFNVHNGLKKRFEWNK